MPRERTQYARTSQSPVTVLSPDLSRYILSPATKSSIV